MEWHKNWKSIVPAAACGFAFTTTMPIASAFFPPVPPPGETVTVVPIAPPAPIIVPPVVVPPTTVPPINLPPSGGTNPGKPQSVPEPGTIIAAGSGLATLAGWSLRKKKTNKGS